MDKFNFSVALEAIKEGKKVTREGWNGQGMYIAAQYPDSESANLRPYIFMIPVDGRRVPWIASQTDLFAEDWSVVE